MSRRASSSKQRSCASQAAPAADRAGPASGYLGLVAGTHGGRGAVIRANGEPTGPNRSVRSYQSRHAAVISFLSRATKFHLELRAPTNWPWREAFETALARIAPIPAPT